jgi:hypothetical protein
LSIDNATVSATEFVYSLKIFNVVHSINKETIVRIINEPYWVFLSTDRQQIFQEQLRLGDRLYSEYLSLYKTTYPIIT